ncbi:hypothetical protein BY458DRAFT_512695 [Sporodiniella umbellata]|nr:hypothetical protein BY458DRAFT_512695 [Sporodiniella umbellata]
MAPSRESSTTECSLVQRSALFISPKKSSPRSATSTKKNYKKWRWWNILAAFIFLITLFEMVAVSTSYNSIQKEKPRIAIVKRQYPTVDYTHLDTELLTSADKETRVYHITKEFGPATTSSLGRYVTGLASAQQASGANRVAVVMPLYAFMKKMTTGREADLTFEMHGKHPGQTFNLDFHVFKMTFAFNPPAQEPRKYEYKFIKGVNTSILVSTQRKPGPKDSVPIYLIGPGNKRPFNQAFKSYKLDDIHKESAGLPLEWQDQYFAKAAAAFLSHKATASDEESIFAPIRIVPRVDVVHIHGASNAYISKYLYDRKKSNELGPRPPAIVYTMYNNTDELKYANSVHSVQKFLDRSTNNREKLSRYVRGRQVFMSQLAIDNAEVVTFTDQLLAKDIIEGRKDFYLKELVMDSLLQKAQRSRFYGIDQAVDYHGTGHPFSSNYLRNKTLIYPQYALDMINHQTPLQAPSSSQSLTQWNLSKSPRDFVRLYKENAKKYLIRRGVLDNTIQAVVLFHGKFEEEAGLEILERAAHYFASHDMRFILLGTRKGYPMERLEALKEQYPDHIYLISRATDERRLGMFCRVAADFVFVTHENLEEFTLQSAQGLIFGSAVIANSADNTKSILIDRTKKGEVAVTFSDSKQTERGANVTSNEYYNAYLYNNEASLATAVADAALDYQKITADKAIQEEFVLRTIRSAFSLAWDQSHCRGPVYEYNQVYKLALQDRVIPEMKRYEVERESKLISRLQKMEESLS